MSNFLFDWKSWKLFKRWMICLVVDWPFFDKWAGNTASLLDDEVFKLQRTKCNYRPSWKFGHVGNLHNWLVFAHTSLKCSSKISMICLDNILHFIFSFSVAAQLLLSKLGKNGNFLLTVLKKEAVLRFCNNSGHFAFNWMINVLLRISRR